MKNAANMLDQSKAILDAAQAFADEFAFNDDRFRSENTYQASNNNGRFTVRLMQDAPGFVVEASASNPANMTKIHEKVRGYILERIEPVECPQTEDDKADGALVSQTPRKGQGEGLVSQSDREKIAQIKEGRITSRSQDPALRQYHQSRSKTYSVEGGNAPTAAMVNRSANSQGFCTEIIEFTVTDDLVRAHVRVTDPGTGQYKEDGVAFTRAAFVAKKTIDIVNKHIKANPDLVLEVDPASLRPIINSAIQIYGVPAPLFVAKEVLKSWNFLGRFAVTTAERRCQDKLLNAEFREREEIELERQEMADVAEGSA